MTTDVASATPLSLTKPAASVTIPLSTPASTAASTVLLVGTDPNRLGTLATTLAATSLTFVGAVDPTNVPTGTAADIALLIVPLATPVPAAVRQLLASGSATHVVIISGDADVPGDVLIDALSAGADGWLSSEIAPEVLERALGAIRRGEPAISRLQVAELISFLREPVHRDLTLDGGRVARLTPREHEILLALAGNSTTRQIANRLSLSQGTVRWHSARLMRKLNVTSRGELPALLERGGPILAATIATAFDAAPTPEPRPIALMPRSASPTDLGANTVLLRPGRKVPEATAVAWASLAESERRVVRLVAGGMTNREVADHLFLSKHTIDSHLKKAFVKLGVRSRVELVRTVLAQEPLPIAN